MPSRSVSTSSDPLLSKEGADSFLSLGKASVFSPSPDEGEGRGRVSRPFITLLCVSLCVLVAGCGKKTAPVVSKPAPVVPVVPAKPAKKELALPPPLPVSWKPSIEQFEKANEKSRLVALTFDAGADANAVYPILSELKKHNARATFFLTGKFCEHFPKQVKAIVEAGMELGNHSYSHPKFTSLSESEIRAQLEKAEKAIVKACGRGAKPLFRFPYGDCDRRTRKQVAAAGYQAIYWSVDSWDSFGPERTADFVANRINRKIRPGYISLMHVSSVGSAKSLPRVFAKLDKLGAKCVPVSELLMAEISKPARLAKQ